MIYCPLTLRDEPDFTSIWRFMRKGYWDEDTVGDFRPERYLDESGAFSLKSGPNLAFSAGVRGCFGQKMAVSVSFRFRRLFRRAHPLSNFFVRDRSFSSRC